MTEYQQSRGLAQVVANWRDREPASIPARTASGALKIAATLLTAENATRLASVEVLCQNELVARWVSDHKNWRVVPVPATTLRRTA